MEIFIEKQLISVGYSLVLGLIFGAAYDIIRIIHILCGIASYSGERKHTRGGKLPFIVFFIFDLVYMTAVSAAFSVFVYWVNYGDFRWYLLFGAICGFAAYHLTLGRAVMYLSEAVVKFIRLVFRYTVAIPLGFIWRLVGRLLRFVYRHTLGRLVKIINEVRLGRRNARYLRQMDRDIKFGVKQ